MRKPFRGTAVSEGNSEINLSNGIVSTTILAKATPAACRGSLADSEGTRTIRRNREPAHLCEDCEYCEGVLGVSTAREGRRPRSVVQDRSQSPGGRGTPSGGGIAGTGEISRTRNGGRGRSGRRSQSAPILRKALTLPGTLGALMKKDHCTLGRLEPFPTLMPCRVVSWALQRTK